MKLYLRFAIMMCKLTRTQPSYLLHPLDFIGGDHVPELKFFPGMNVQMKKKLEKTSRKGMTAPSVWWLYSDSEMMSPARNAPSASESPANDVSQATEKQITRTEKRNISRFLVLETW